MNRSQITFSIGSGEQGQYLVDLIEQQKSRLKLASKADVLRVALYTLAKSKESQIVRYNAVPTK